MNLKRLKVYRLTIPNRNPNTCSLKERYHVTFVQSNDIRPDIDE